MTIYEQAKECVPENTWPEVIEQWKRLHPDPNQYVFLSGGDEYMRQEWASALMSRGIPFMCHAAVPFLSLFGMYDGFNGEEGDTVSPIITFTSLPKEFTIGSLSTLPRIEYYNGMIYYCDVPLPILAKMHELGKLFTH